MEAGFSVTDSAPSTQLSATFEHVEVFRPLTTRTVKLLPLTLNYDGMSLGG